MIIVNLDKARKIHCDHIRRVRAPLFESKDVAFMRAVESGDTAAQAAIAAEKQELRNLTSHPSISAATTVDELKASWPQILGKSPY